ncbi:uncharacterized protein E6C27_scaffold22G003010 [Cucumis melo var. makuwa]|uniref:Ulp1-like peptidase n=1 Tax=Cucumis melo var. makuwa TaxID=1194695 RepID=A0A5A7V419_CUCMM|nr:uncharacterized protein E6C27_scaffold22G003010 [Cucumis melo var. makuwa]
MFIIKAVIEMTPEEEQLKIASGELFENFRSSTIIQSKNGGSKRLREVVNDEDDFKKSKKQKSKTKMKKAIQNLQDRVAVVEGQLNSIKSDIDELKGMMLTILKHIGLRNETDDEGDRKVSEGLVDHTLESKEVDNAKTEDVDTGGTPNWLRMPKEDEHIELKKKGDEDVLEKKVDIGLEEPIDVVDDDDVTEIEPFLTERPHVWPPRRKRASVYLSTPFTTLHKRLRAWITNKRTDDEVRETFHGKQSKVFFRDLFMCRRWLADEHLDALFLFIHLMIKAAGIPSSQNFTTANTIFMVWNRHPNLVAKWPLYKERIKENRPFD